MHPTIGRTRCCRSSRASTASRSPLSSFSSTPQSPALLLTPQSQEAHTSEPGIPVEPLAKPRGLPTVALRLGDGVVEERHEVLGLDDQELERDEHRDREDGAEPAGRVAPMSGGLTHVVSAASSAVGAARRMARRKPMSALPFEMAWHSGR